MTKTQEEQYLKAIKSIAKSLATIAKNSTSNEQKDEPRTFNDNFPSKSTTRSKRLVLNPPFELYFDSIEEAEDVLNELRSIIQQYGFVRIADLFDLAEVTPPEDYIGDDYGWDDLNSVEVEFIGIGVKHSSEWRIMLPMYSKVYGG